jgi:hypothetical protein
MLCIWKGLFVSSLKWLAGWLVLLWMWCDVMGCDVKVCLVSTANRSLRTCRMTLSSLLSHCLPHASHNHQHDIQGTTSYYTPPCKPSSNAPLIRGKLQQSTPRSIFNHPDRAVPVFPNTAHTLPHGDTLSLPRRITGNSHVTRTIP